MSSQSLSDCAMASASARHQLTTELPGFLPWEIVWSEPWVGSWGAVGRPGDLQANWDVDSG